MKKKSNLYMKSMGRRRNWTCDSSVQRYLLHRASVIAEFCSFFIGSREIWRMTSRRWGRGGTKGECLPSDGDGLGNHFRVCW